MEEKLSINLNIADRRYPLRIERVDEEKIRKAAKIINERVAQYQQRYANKDSQDCLSMATLQFVIQNLEVDQRNDLSPMVEQLEEMNDSLAEYLDKEI